MTPGINLSGVSYLKCNLITIPFSGKLDIFLEKQRLFGYNSGVVGDWPSGKALGSGPRIGGSNPSSPAKSITQNTRQCSMTGLYLFTPVKSR